MNWTGFESSGYSCIDDTGYDLEEEVEDEPHSHQQDEHYVQNYVQEIKPSYSVYKRKYELLSEKLSLIKHDTVSMAHRISKIKKLINKSLKNRSLLMAELDSLGDDYTNIPVTSPFLEPHVKQEVTSEPKEKKSKKLKVERDSVSRDPNLPKRPQNPFFQFCKEQRDNVAEQVLAAEGIQLSKKELTKLLAQKWNELSLDEKQVYNDKFEEERIHYNIKMADYKRSKQGGEHPQASTS